MAARNELTVLHRVVLLVLTPWVRRDGFAELAATPIASFPDRFDSHSPIRRRTTRAATPADNRGRDCSMIDLVRVWRETKGQRHRNSLLVLHMSQNQCNELANSK